MASESTKPEGAAAPATTAPEQKNDAAKPALGEDDEFEDFPVDGKSLQERDALFAALGFISSSLRSRFESGGSRAAAQSYEYGDQAANLGDKTGQTTRPRPPRRPTRASRASTCGRRAGTTTTRVMTFRSSSSTWQSHPRALCGGDPVHNPKNDADSPREELKKVEASKRR